MPSIPSSWLVPTVSVATVRFSWKPVAGVQTTDPAKTPVDDYLQGELRERLKQWPARMMLMMMIGEAGDVLEDPTVPWPARRVRVVMGTLTLTEVAKDQVADCEKLSFNPWRLVTGIEPSGDPTLKARRDAYEEFAHQARRHAMPVSADVKVMPMDGATEKGLFGRLGDQLDEFVGWLATTRLFKCIAARILVPYWAWRRRCKPQPGGPRPSVQPGDNVQRMMNLVMPLKDKSAVGRALAALAIAQNKDEIYAGLDNVGTVHFARFVIVDDNICMFSVYDGDFTNYIRDFIVTIGSVFDAVVGLVEGGESVIPSGEHIDKFIDWVHDARPVSGIGSSRPTSCATRKR